jgi:predicted kinase
MTASNDAAQFFRDGVRRDLESSGTTDEDFHLVANATVLAVCESLYRTGEFLFGAGGTGRGAWGACGSGAWREAKRGAFRNSKRHLKAFLVVAGVFPAAAERDVEQRTGGSSELGFETATEPLAAWKQKFEFVAGVHRAAAQVVPWTAGFFAKLELI